MLQPLTILPDPPPPPTPIGLIAGGGRLPIIVAEGLRARGHTIHGLGLARQYEPELPTLCSTFREVGLLRLASWGRVLSRLGVRHAIMVGKVDKAKILHDRSSLVQNIPDLAAAMLWWRTRRDRRSHAVLAALADSLDRSGVKLLDSTVSISNELATEGVMGRVQATAAQRADIEFAWPLLAQTLRLDIGQAIAVRQLDVLGVEAIEGTDRMIERVGLLCRVPGWTLCKGARAGHDRRSDVPTVGITTIAKLHEHGGGCLALAAGDVIMVDKGPMLELADQLGIAVVGMPVMPA